MTTTVQTANRVALSVSVRGVVQGVGFRPFVHRLALEYGICGWVRNESGQVRMAVEGPQSAVDRFVHDLTAKAPPLARIDSLHVVGTASQDIQEFRICASHDQPDRRQPVSPDMALCRRCEAELFDPHNRRFRYPFITCTDCGPRYTIVHSMPFDRERTSMRAFTQCTACSREYHTPEDRRYHCESNSCHDCGPRLWLESADQGTAIYGREEALQKAADLLLRGQILALRGLGGFHLAVDATDEAAVERLRAHKNREAKPLAVMVRTVAQARDLGLVSSEERQLLTSAERPVVLLDAKRDSTLAPSVAPDLDTVGVMTAYTPLHHLLLDLVRRPLVMTSGNSSAEPIAIGNDDAREKLGNVADAFLMHDREIIGRYDDSVVRLVDAAPVLLRRARGYAPLPVTMPVATPAPLVAVGPHFKHTFTLAQGSTAYMSQHIGDLENLETLEHSSATLEAYSRMFRIVPEVAVRDLHPAYLSSRVAEELGLAATLTVQHHHAHIAAVAAEHGITDCVIGVAYDGTGYGDDGAVWGGEILVADLTAYDRLCQLRYAPLPGGDLAARRPWRAALGYLSLDRTTLRAFGAALEGLNETEVSVAQQQIERAINAPVASSMGRLFDAAAAVLGVRRVSRYEGHAAMELEALAGRGAADPLPFPVVEGAGVSWVMDPLPLLVALGERRLAGEDVASLAARFHESLACATVTAVRRVRTASGISTVALGGGVFQNRRLLSSVTGGLKDAGFRVLVPRRLSPNDGAISFGQAAVAAALLRDGKVASPH